MAEPVGPNFVSKAMLTAGRLAHQPFEIPTEMTNSALLQGGVTHNFIGATNQVMASAVADLKPRGPAKLLDKLFERVDKSLVGSAQQAQKATELFWVPFSEGSHQIGHAVSNPFAMAYGNRVGFDLSGDPVDVRAALAAITDPVEGSTKFPGLKNWPTPPPPAETPPAETPPAPTPPADEAPPAPKPEDGAPAPTPTPDGEGAPAPTPTPEGEGAPAPTPTPEGEGAPAPTPTPEGEGAPAPTPEGAATGGGETRSLAPTDAAQVTDATADVAPVTTPTAEPTASDAPAIDAAPAAATAGATEGAATIAAPPAVTAEAGPST